MIVAMWCRAALFFSVCLSLPACRVAEQSSRPPAADAVCRDEPTEGDTPHDRHIRDELMRGLAELAESNATATLATLRGQLDRHAAELELDAPSTTELSGVALHDQVLPAVAVVGRRYLCDKCSHWHLSAATGFFITADGACVTSRHVVDGKDGEALAVMTADGKVHAVRGIRATSKTDDIAILDVEGDGFPHLPLRADIRTGAPVFVLSHPAGTYWYLTSGLVGRRFVDDSGATPSTESLDITADFARGSSGAPVLDATGAVVGVVRATNSIYYTEQNGVQKNLQMVLKRCVPASAGTGAGLGLKESGTATARSARGDGGQAAPVSHCLTSATSSVWNSRAMRSRTASIRARKSAHVPSPSLTK